MITREKSSKIIGSLDDSLVAGNVGHGTQRIKYLRSTNPRNAIHRKSCHVTSTQGLDQFCILTRIQKAYQSATVSELPNLRSRRTPYF